MPVSEFYDFWKMGVTFVCVVGIVVFIVELMEAEDRKNVLHVTKNLRSFYNLDFEKSPLMIALAIFLFVPIFFHHLGNLLNVYIDVFGLIIHVAGVIAIDILIYTRIYKKSMEEESINTGNSDKGQYSDFEENAQQSQANHSKSDDEFSYDGGRFADDRFTTARKKQSYTAAYKAENDKSITLEERIPYFKFREQADEGKIKGIAPWQPPKP